MLLHPPFRNKSVERMKENNIKFSGCHKGKSLICCGDNKGSLWVYKVPQFGKDSSGAAPIKKVVEPSVWLMWPELYDDLRELMKGPI